MAEVPDTLEATGDDGLIRKVHTVSVGVGNAPADTKQPDDSPLDLGTPDDCLEPPEPPELFANWSTFNSVRKACIEAISLNTVGRGYDLQLGEGHDDVQDPTELIRKATRDIETLPRWDRRALRPTLTEQLKMVKHDEEECGLGALEIARSRKGTVVATFHAPGKRVRRRKDRKGWKIVPIDGNLDAAQTFLDFGDKAVYDRDGKPTGIKPGAAGMNELLVFKLYTSESRDYGLPRDAAMAVDYLAEKYAVEANSGFFDAGGTLPTVLFVQGEERKEGGEIHVEVPHEVAQRMDSVLRSKTGTQRVAIVPLPNGVKAQKEVLGQMSDRDFGFVNFRDDIRARTLTSFRMSPIFLALPEESGYGAEVERSLTKEQVFDPEQVRYSERVGMIVADAGYPMLDINFRDLAIENDASRRSSADKRAEAGTITRRDHIRMHGGEPYPEAKQSETEIEWQGKTYKSEQPGPGQVPFGWNDEIVNTGRPDGAQNREADGQQGKRPGLGGRGSRDRGQAESEMNAVGRQTKRLAGRNGQATRGGAARALERARALPEG